MKSLHYFAFIFFIISCKKQENKIIPVLETVVNLEKEVLKSDTKDPILYFENALIYEVDVDGKKEQFWFYVNEKTKQILFDPNDEMIDGIISFPNGEYKMYSKGEFEDNIITSEKIEAVVDNFVDDSVLKSNNQTKTISGKNSPQVDIICKGFIMKYQQMEGSETLFVTNQIPINALQIYGFARLQGDAIFPINLDYLNVFNKNQLFTHIYNPQLALRLITYESNPYEFDTSGYKMRI